MAAPVGKARELRVVHLQAVWSAAAALVIETKGVGSGEIHHRAFVYSEWVRCAEAGDNELVPTGVREGSEIGLQDHLILRYRVSSSGSPTGKIVRPGRECCESAGRIHLRAAGGVYELEAEIS